VSRVPCPVSLTVPDCPLLSLSIPGAATYTVSDDRRVDHVPSTQHYDVEEVMLDLLHR
jgi:hypothetical protein